MFESDPLKYVNSLQGTDSRREFSTGNTYPAIGAPRGMTYWTPQTCDGRFIFDRREKSISGIRATHSPSPWMGDFGHFDILPLVGTIAPTSDERASPYSLERAVFAPNQASVRFDRYGTSLRMAATSRCAVFEMSFPDASNAAIVFQTGFGEEQTLGEVAISSYPELCEIAGVSHSNHGGCPDGFGCYFVASIEAPALGFGIITEKAVRSGTYRYKGPRAGAFVNLAGNAMVTVRVATSYISLEQARFNLNREVQNQSLDTIAEDTAQLWNDWINRIHVRGGTRDDQVCLASAMYRVGLFPMAMHEPNGEGGIHHYSPYDGNVHSGKLFTNNGFWDTHRTVYPLLALIDPEGFGEIVVGFLQAYRQTGWLPKWASPGFRNCMIGTHIDAVISEAVMRGIPGFDYPEAYEAIRRHAFVESDSPTEYGRMGLLDYDRLGYVPVEAAPYSVSRTLDFCHLDWCIAQVATHLGHDEDAAYLLRRSKNYRNLYFAEAKLMRPKHADGTWETPWSPFAWGGGYIEGSAWQHSFNVPHDPLGLAELMDGPEQLTQMLEKMLSYEPIYEVGCYNETIHEMSEMRLAKDAAGKSFGQYAHSNQPVHGYLWMPATYGQTSWTDRQVRRVLEGLYAPDKLPGDEDNGEMSAWYLLAAMGKYPACAGSGRMVTVPCDIFEQLAPHRDGRQLRFDPAEPSLAPASPSERILD